MATPYNSDLLYDGMGTYNSGFLFTPPDLLVVPPISVADHKIGPSTLQANRQGYNLMRYMPMRDRGVNVWHMNDDTFWMSDPVTGVTFTGTIGWPYPDTDNPVNDAISSAWYPGGIGGVGGSGPGGDIEYVIPGIKTEYLGGRSYPVSAAEAALITSVGLGAYLS